MESLAQKIRRKAGIHFSPLQFLLLHPLRGRKISCGRTYRVPDKSDPVHLGGGLGQDLARRQIARDTQQSHFRRPAAMTEIGATSSSGTPVESLNSTPTEPVAGVA